MRLQRVNTIHKTNKHMTQHLQTITVCLVCMLHECKGAMHNVDIFDHMLVLVSPSHRLHVSYALVLCSNPYICLKGAADEDAYLSDDSVDPDDMTYEVTHAQFTVPACTDSLGHHIHSHKAQRCVKICSRCPQLHALISFDFLKVLHKLITHVP